MGYLDSFIILRSVHSFGEMMKGMYRHVEIYRKWWEEHASLSIWPIWCCVRSWKDMFADGYWKEKDCDVVIGPRVVDEK